MEENEIEVWHWPPGAIETFETRAYGYQMHESYLFFWPDSKGYEEGTAVVAPGYEAEDISRFAKWVNPLFGVTSAGSLRETLCISRQIDFMKRILEIRKKLVNTRFLEDGYSRDQNCQRSPSTGFRQQPKLCMQQIRTWNCCENHHQFTALLKTLLYAVGPRCFIRLRIGICSRFRCKRPVSFAEGFEALVENKSSQIEKEVRVLGIVDDGVAEPKFTWILSQEE